MAARRKKKSRTGSQPQSQDWRKIAARVRNWGRWGDSDQLGTLNHITPEKIVRAATLVKRGRIFSLSIPLDAYGPQGSHGFRRNPIHLMSVDGGDLDADSHLTGWGGGTEAEISQLWKGPLRFNDDYIMMPLQAGTQWDALSHVYYDKQLYNGYPASAVTSFGATKDSIDQVAEKGLVVSRGVLLDVARHRGLKYLAPNTVVFPEELDEVAKASGVQVEPGDVAVIRTGWRVRFLETSDGESWTVGSPGLSWRCAQWLYDHDAAAVASDNIAVEVVPSEIAGVNAVLHLLTLRDMGMMLGEMWDLEDLSDDCAKDGVYEFLLVAQPLRVSGAVGSPVNPVAIK